MRAKNMDPLWNAIRGANLHSGIFGADFQELQQPQAKTS